jgi:hypothetical protein
MQTLVIHGNGHRPDTTVAIFDKNKERRSSPVMFSRA